MKARGSQVRLLGWGVMAAVLVGALLVGTLTDGPERNTDDRVYDLASSMKCPQCVSQTVADSEASIAVQMREEIRTQVDEGRSDEEIRDYFVSRYGETVLLAPPTTGISLFVWAIPALGVAVALGAVLLVVRGRRRAAGAGLSDSDRALVDDALTRRHAEQP